MKNLPGIAACVLLVWLAAGCQTGGRTSGYYDPPLLAGSELEIRQSIEVPAGYARVYLQAGRMLSYAGIDQYAPFCYLLMRQPLPVSQLIGAGTFRVEKVYQLESDVSSGRSLRVASSGLLAGGWERGLMAFQTHMKLAGTEQPDVHALVCSGAFAEPRDAQPIRLPEVQRALGALAVIRALSSPLADR